MMPICHRNTINFLGMGQQRDYLIWRQKDGFFSALTKTQKIHTWSIATGKHVGKDVCNLNVMGYKIYQANSSDDSYVKNFMNFKDGAI
jgi:hypothetical protein